MTEEATIKTRQVGIYLTKYGSEVVNEISDWFDNNSDYVRITQVIEVEFVPLDHDVILQARIESLDREIENVRADAERKISDLKDQKQRLMAIEDQRDSDEKGQG